MTAAHRLRRLLLLAVAFGLCALPATGPATGQHADTLSIDTAWLDVLMQHMAAIPTRQAEFVEEKHLAALKQPLISRGRLVYRRPSYLEKITTGPQPETLIVNGDQLSIQSAGQAVRAVSLASQPVIAGLVDGVRATLAGDLPQLQQFYRVTAEGRVAAWRLVLTPEQPRLAQVLRSVTLEGADTDVRTVKVVAANGDEQGMSITAVE